MKKWIFITAILFVLAAVILALGGVIYSRHLQTTPQYSLALVIHAAQNEDSELLNELIDSDAVVDSLVPQVIEKAEELYGRGLPPALITKLNAVASPLMPAVKERVRTEIPGLLKRETKTLSDIPFAVLVLTADKYLDIVIEADEAKIRSKSSGPSIEVAMKRRGSRWLITGVRDETLSRSIAEAIGQQIIGFASGNDLNKAAESLGIKDLDSLIKKAEEFIK